MRELLSSSSGGVARELMKRGRRVETRAKELAPVDTGRLRSSITVTPVTVDGDFAVHVGTNVEYAPYAHRRGLPAAHYLREALAAAFT